MPIITPTPELMVLLTRPKEKSEQLAAHLSKLNITSYIQPLFDYQPLAKSAEIKQVITSADIVIFVSVPAVNYTQACYPLAATLNNIQVFAVGQATQLALQALGVNNVYSPQAPLLETSEGLLQLPELQNVANKRVVIFRGNGGREHIANSLRERGAQLDYIESYQRVWNALSVESLTHWKSNKINCIVATSNDILTALVELIDHEDDHQKKFWREQCIWLVASQRIVDNAKRLGISQVINCQGASTQKISAVLQQLQQSIQ